MSNRDEEIIRNAEETRDEFLNSRRQSKANKHLNNQNNPESTGKIPPPRPLDEAAYYGFTGEFIRLVEPQSEADPAAILVSFLTAAGNIFGNAPRFKVESAYHPMRLYLAIAGKSSRSRKGTSWGYIERLYTLIDLNWKINSGLSSGEGLIFAVRDKITKTNKKNEEEIVDEGVNDKRLLIVEEELSSVLKIVGREGNILSQLVRSAWDKDLLQTLTKNSPIKATKAHVSIIGHITIEELLRCLNSTEISNGFGNRFLWVYAKRSKLLPNGGKIDEGAFNRVVARLRIIVDFVQGLNKTSWTNEEIENVKNDSCFTGWQSDRQIVWSNDAQLLWDKIYFDLSQDDEVGIVGALLSRAEAYVCRLSSIYALLDKSFEISVNHLRAAVAIWDYVDSSVRFIFQGKTGDPLANKIIDALAQNLGGLTRTDINKHFNHNVDSEQLSISLETLLKLGRIKCESIPTEGRSAELFSLSSSNSYSQKDKTYLQLLDEYISDLNNTSQQAFQVDNELNEKDEQTTEGVKDE